MVGLAGSESGRKGGAYAMETTTGTGSMNQRGKGIEPFRLYAGAFVLGSILAGCGGGPVQQDPSWSLVPITDVSMVAGEWEGTVKKDHAVLPEGLVQLTIHANGTYTFIGERISDVVLGSGFLEIRDGRLSGDTDRRIATFTLYNHEGKNVLAIESTVRPTGERYYGELTRAKK